MTGGAKKVSMSMAVPEEGCSGVYTGYTGVTTYAIWLICPGNPALFDGRCNICHGSVTGCAVAIGSGVAGTPVAFGGCARMTVVTGGSFAGVVSMDCLGQVFSVECIGGSQGR